jgi:hypothetical protein
MFFGSFGANFLPVSMPYRVAFTVFYLSYKTSSGWRAGETGSIALKYTAIEFFTRISYFYEMLT